MKLVKGVPAAVALIRGGAEDPCIKGTVGFYPLPYGVLVEAEIGGFRPDREGFLGFHIHEGSSCDGENFAATGGHWNPGEMLHPMHAGDLPPLLVSGGRAYLCVLTSRFSIRDIIGRTVVIHSMADDLHSQPAGNSGEKIGCGVISSMMRRM